MDNTWVANYRRALYHHGIKGQKWGVRNGPPYPLSRNRNKVVKQTITGHAGSPKIFKPNGIIDRKSKSGTITGRTFYSVDGLKRKEIHTTNHGNSKQHPYGNKGEHVHDFFWDENGNFLYKTTRELKDSERKENQDIL